MILSALLGKGKLIGLAVVGIALAGAIAYHYWTVSSLQSDLNKTLAVNSTLRADLIQAVNNQENLKLALDDQENTIAILNTQRKIDQEKLNELADQYAQSQSEVDELEVKLSRHDFDYLSLKKPGLMENIINRGTADVGQTLMNISGGASE